MILSEVNEILKGGRGSGDFGHTGRAGKRGGSGGRGGRSRKNLDNAKKFLVSGGISDLDAFTLIRNIGAEVVLAANAAYDNFSHGGLTSEITELRKVGKQRSMSLSIEGKIRNSSGMIVGGFERNISKIGTDVNSNHEFFELDKSVQNKGFGSKFYQHSENELIKGGVNKIILEANLSVGGYAWARMGFDALNGLSSPFFNMSMKWEKHYGNRDNIPPDLTDMKPWEVAVLRGPDGFRIGKKLLLGSSWDGIKDLSEGSIGRKIGDAYYASKDR